MRRYIVLFLLTVVSLNCFSQARVTYASGNIPENLSKGSDAVIREMRLEYKYDSPTSAAEKHSVVISVLNEAGKSDAELVIYTDMFRSLKSFTGEIFDSAGKSVRKIKRSDLKSTDYFSGLASDMRTWYFEPTAAAYPFTVKYEYELSHKGGILTFPVFAPVSNYNVGVEKAEYILTLPENTRFHMKNFNTDIAPEVTKEKGTERYVWKLGGFEPMDAVPYRADYINVFPAVYLTPHYFTYNRKSGTMDTWDGYAKWQWALLEGRDVLPEECKVKVRELTADAANDREKVERLYDYLKETRYVLISIGVGGFQPMSAAEVYRNKFGDCKGLSNYMMAMLAECGIESYYTEIGSGSGSRKLRDDYVHPSQTNHAILYVPLDGEELWLECTNPNMPFGYVHSRITDRKALVYRNNTAELVDMPSYPDSVNTAVMEVTARIKPDGTVDADIKTTYRMSEYEYVMGFGKLSSADRLAKISGSIKLPLYNVSDIGFAEEKSAEPWASVSYKLSGNVNMSGSRIFIPVNPFRNNPSARLRRSRSQDICINHGYRNVDDLQIELPEGYSVEAFPGPMNIENRFGHFRMVVLPVDGKVMVRREMQLNKGTYPSEEYEEFKALMGKISEGNGAQIIMVKK